MIFFYLILLSVCTFKEFLTLMNLFKRIGNIFMKMAPRRKPAAEKLSEELVQSPATAEKIKAKPIRDIEDIIKSEPTTSPYFSPIQTRNQRMSNSIAGASTAAFKKLKPISSLANQAAPASVKNVTEIEKPKNLSAREAKKAKEINTIIENLKNLPEVEGSPIEIVAKQESESVVVKGKKVTKATRVPKKAAKSLKVESIEEIPESTVSSIEVVKQVPEPVAAKTKKVTNATGVPKKTAKASKVEDIEERPETTARSIEVVKQDPIVTKTKKTTKAKRVTKITETALKLEPVVETLDTNGANSIEVPLQKEESPASPVKVTKRKSKDSPKSPEAKLEKWEPTNWRQILDNIRAMRASVPAPVDTMGCDRCSDENADEKTRRFHVLLALMLSSQTKDEVTHEAMRRLTAEGNCTPQSIAEMDPKKLETLLYPVSFYKNKAKYLQNTSNILVEQYDSDIPNDIKGLIKLPGVGPKMAHICMNSAWNIVTGIGVDVHVHRISNRLNWVRQETKQPEQTRKELESWLPSEHWKEVNHMLVGFGQTICTPVKPKCGECLNKAICPAAFAVKPKKVKAEKVAL